MQGVIPDKGSLNILLDSSKIVCEGCSLNPPLSMYALSSQWYKREFQEENRQQTILLLPYE